MPVRCRSQGLRRRSVRTAELARRGQAMLESLGLSDAELSILLCDDDTIRLLNQRYRKRDAPTDVLAFPMRDETGPESPYELLGDVVISVPTAVRQAQERDRTIIAEVTFLLAHGLLHLLGYDHATPQEEREMTARTERLVQAVRAHGWGFSPVDIRTGAGSIRASNFVARRGQGDEKPQRRRHQGRGISRQ